MDALIDHMGTFIRWPSKEEYEDLAGHFDGIGR